MSSTEPTSAISADHSTAGPPSAAGSPALGAGEELRQASVAELMRALMRSLRPQQWIKNLFVLAPLFFSKTFLIPSKLALGFGAAFLFCMTAGTVYLLNDIFDVAKDRAHPVKRHRPIASGALPLSVARMSAVTLGLGSVACALLVDLGFALVLGGYLLMNLAYSMQLKHLAFIDVSIIAVGFVLRVVAGALAIDVYISEWLLACTFFLALYLGLGKRQHELNMFLAGEVSKTRKVLERYRAEHLDFGVLFVAGMTIAVYTIYTLTAALPDQPLRTHQTPFASAYLPITIPFAVFGITRFYQLIKKDSPYSPTDLLLRDWPFIVNLALWGVVMSVLSFL
ncbi:MAG: decaprenyl-phosphate phosphoribosyltransferase [Bradymonadaceae bacterium]|nr:decaprenyl-phosphate phosphoribosyltransferase [Lujinxingiaceae bacterium]